MYLDCQIEKELELGGALNYLDLVCPIMDVFRIYF